MASQCIFCKIANKEIKTPLIYEDGQVVAFHDINPQAPIHLLIIPKEHIATINELEDKHNPLIGQLLQTAKQLAAKHQIAEEGYRVVINCNEKGGQAVYHLHLHLLGGKQMHWPPG